jgi:hypothetical protein
MATAADGSARPRRENWAPPPPMRGVQSELPNNAHISFHDYYGKQRASWSYSIRNRPEHENSRRTRCRNQTATHDKAQLMCDQFSVVNTARRCRTQKKKGEIGSTPTCTWTGQTCETTIIAELLPVVKNSSRAVLCHALHAPIETSHEELKQNNSPAGKSPHNGR